MRFSKIKTTPATMYIFSLPLAIILFITKDGVCHALECSTPQVIRNGNFTRCPGDSVLNENGLIGEPLMLRSSSSCAAKCLNNPQCLSYSVKPENNRFECLLSTVYDDCSGLIPTSGARTYMRAVRCEKGMPEVPATSPYPAPLFNITVGPQSSKMLFLCDSTTDKGGWYILQRRNNGQTNFYRGWNNYKSGFGTFDTEFWIGLDTIYSLTSSATYEIRIDLMYQGNSAYAVFANFSVGSEAEKYKLSLGQYCGTAGDSLGKHSGYYFSTHDRDNDISSNNCAQEYQGAWWYERCAWSNLNGKWAVSSGAFWDRFSGYNPVSSTEIKIRKVMN